MAWHKIGDSFYSTKEVNAHEDAALLTFVLFNIGIPGLMTYFCLSPMIDYLDSVAFFTVHTTIAKLLYIVSGLIIFSVAYAIRKIVVSLVVVGVCIAIVGGVLWMFGRWLFA